MSPPSPVELCLSIGAVVFVVGGTLVRYRWSVTRYQIPKVVLVLLTVTIGLTGVVGALLTAGEAEKIDYRTEITPQGCENDSVREHEALDYGELSPDAQAVFRSALKADDRYTTSTLPDEFQLKLDANPPNYITYNSNCYALGAEQRGNFATGFVVTLYLTSSILAAFVLCIAIPLSWSLGIVKTPMAILAGLGSTGGLFVSGVTQPGQLAGVPVLIGVLTWIVLRVFELRSQESFQERMNS